jgi:hypothetical protein
MILVYQPRKNNSNILLTLCMYSCKTIRMSKNDPKTSSKQLRLEPKNHQLLRSLRKLDPRMSMTAQGNKALEIGLCELMKQYER